MSTRRKHLVPLPAPDPLAGLTPEPPVRDIEPMLPRTPGRKKPTTRRSTTEVRMKPSVGLPDPAAVLPLIKALLKERKSGNVD